MLDSKSFGLGFAVGPVGYILFGAVIYGVFCIGKRLVSLLGNKT